MFSFRRLIEQLVETLRKAARDASDAIVKFSAAVQEEAISIRNRIVSNIQKLRERVNNAFESVRNRLIDSGVAIVDCIGVSWMPTQKVMKLGRSLDQLI